MSKSRTMPFLLTCEVTIRIYDTLLNSIDYKIKDAVLDTGSTITIGNLEYFQKLGIPINKLDNEIQLTNILNSSMPNIQHFTKGALIFSNTQHIVNDVSIYLVDTVFSQHKLLIGLDTLAGLKMDLQKNPTITLNNILIEESPNDTIVLRHTSEMEGRDNDIFARETKIINPKETTTIKTINRTQFIIILTMYDYIILP